MPEVRGPVRLRLAADVVARLATRPGRVREEGSPVADGGTNHGHLSMQGQAPRGCGRTRVWTVLDVDGDGAGVNEMQPVSGGAATNADVERARAVLAAAETELADVRAAATKWQAGLASLAGGITVLSLVKGRDDVAVLKAPWGVGFGVLLAIALLATVAGAFCALAAANGIPTSWRTSAWNPRLHAHQQAALAQRFLLFAVGATLLSILLLGTAAGVAWYAPEAKKDPSLSVVSRDGGVVCGTPDHITDAVLVLKTANGPASVKLVDVTTVAAVSSCVGG